MSRSDDPLGRRALFSPPAGVPRPDPFAPEAPQGRRALFDDGAPGREPVLRCGGCGETTVLGPRALVRLVPAVWVPWRPAGVWARCPHCRRRTRLRYR